MIDNSDDIYKVVGPTMVPNKKMLRYHEELGFIEISFTKDQIKSFKNIFHKRNLENNINIEHSNVIYQGAEIARSFILEESNKHLIPSHLHELPEGTWIIELSFNNEDEYNKVTNRLHGFSVEIGFRIKVKGKSYLFNEDFKRMNSLSDLLPFDLYVYGGNTGSTGRSEHGEAHFQLKEKNSRIDLGKIYMPSIKKWNSLSKADKLKLMVVEKGKSLKKKEKKLMVSWLEFNNNENLINSHKQWNESNQDNNRTVPI